MKKIILFGLISFMAILCTGCVKYSYNIDIDDNDNISISKTQAMNLSFFENYDPQFDEKFKEGISKSENEFKQRGYEVKQYKDDIYTGITLTKQNLKFENVIDDLKDDFNNDSYAFSIEKNGLNHSYKIHLIYDFKRAMDNMSGGESASLNSPDMQGTAEEEEGIVSKTKETDPETGEIVERIEYENGAVVTSRYNPEEQEEFGKALGASLGSMPGIKPVSELTIKIPKKATKHNATKVISDTEYYWDLAGENQPVEIILEYEKFDFATLGIIVSVIIALGILGFIFNKAKGGDLNGF